jgi:hypothetical protein
MDIWQTFSCEFLVAITIRPYNAVKKCGSEDVALEFAHAAIILLDEKGALLEGI